MNSAPVFLANPQTQLMETSSRAEKKCMILIQNRLKELNEIDYNMIDRLAI